MFFQAIKHDLLIINPLMRGPQIGAINVVNDRDPSTRFQFPIDCKTNLLVPSLRARLEQVDRS